MIASRLAAAAGELSLGHRSPLLSRTRCVHDVRQFQTTALNPNEPPEISGVFPGHPGWHRPRRPASSCPMDDHEPGSRRAGRRLELRDHRDPAARARRSPPSPAATERIGQGDRRGGRWARRVLRRELARGADPVRAGVRGDRVPGLDAARHRDRRLRAVWIFVPREDIGVSPAGRLTRRFPRIGPAIGVLLLLAGAAAIAAQLEPWLVWPVLLIGGGVLLYRHDDDRAAPPPIQPTAPGYPSLGLAPATVVRTPAGAPADRRANAHRSAGSGWGSRCSPSEARRSFRTSARSTSAWCATRRSSS